MLIQLLDIQDLCLGHSHQISRLLNVASAFISLATQPSESTAQLAATTLELFGSVAAAFPQVLAETTASAAVEVLLARLLEVVDHCCAKPSSIVAETQEGKPEISVPWCVNVLGTVRRVLLHCSPILSDKHRQTIEGAVCVLLQEMLQGIVQPLPTHKALKREAKALVRCDTHIQLAVLELAQVEVQALQRTGGIGANVALLRPCAALFVRATSAPLRDAAAMCMLITDTLLRPVAAPLDLTPAVRRMEDHLVAKADADDNSAHAFAGVQQLTAAHTRTDGLQPEKKRRTEVEEKQRFHLADHLSTPATKQQQQQLPHSERQQQTTSSETKKPFTLPSFGLPANKTQSIPRTAKPAADDDEDDLPDIVLDDPDQL